MSETCFSVKRVEARIKEMIKSGSTVLIVSHSIRDSDQLYKSDLD